MIDAEHKSEFEHAKDTLYLTLGSHPDGQTILALLWLFEIDMKIL